MDKTNDVKGGGGSTTLTVPKEYVEVFRIGLLRELEHGGEWLAGQAKEARRALEKLMHPSYFSPSERLREQNYDPFGCLGGPLRETQGDAEHLTRLGVGTPKSDVVLQGDTGGLKHSCEAVVKHLAEFLAGFELGGPEGRKASTVIAWAAEEAERLEAELVKAAEGVSA